MKRTRLKVCCIASHDEAVLAINSGAHAIGLVGKMPSGPGVISDEQAQEIAEKTPPHISTFLLTNETTAENIAAHVRQVGSNTVQIVNHIDPGESEKLTGLIPDVQRVQVIHVEGADALGLIDCYHSHYNAFLLDSGRPSKPVPELGGTGRVHDWRISRQFVKESPLPVYLAGGLTPDNVEEAVRTVKPYGIDVCSGLRVDDRLNAQKLEAFIGNIAKAEAE